MTDPSKIDAIAEAATYNHLCERNQLMTEAAISAWLDLLDPPTVASVFRRHADDREIFG